MTLLRLIVRSLLWPRKRYQPVPVRSRYMAHRVSDDADSPLFV